MKVYYYIGSSGTVYLDREDLNIKFLTEALIAVDNEDLERNAAVLLLIKERTRSGVDSPYGCIEI